MVTTLSSRVKPCSSANVLSHGVSLAFSQMTLATESKELPCVLLSKFGGTELPTTSPTRLTK